MNEFDLELENWRTATAPTELKVRAMASKRHRRGLILIPALAIAIVMTITYLALRPSPAMAIFRAAESRMRNATNVWIDRDADIRFANCVIAYGAFRLDRIDGRRVYRGPLGRWFFDASRGGLNEDSPSESTYHSASRYLTENVIKNSETPKSVIELDDRDLDGERLHIIRATYQFHYNEIWTTSRESIPRRIDTFRIGETKPYNSCRLRLDIEIDPKAMTPEGLKRPITDFVINSPKER